MCDQNEPPRKKVKLQTTLCFPEIKRANGGDRTHENQTNTSTREGLVEYSRNSDGHAMAAATEEVTICQENSERSVTIASAGNAVMMERIDSVTFSPPVNDIGNAVGKTLSSEEKAVFIEPWKPVAEKEYPTSIHTKNNIERKRRLLPGHFTTFPWLSVSKVAGKEGAYCKACVVFGLSSGVGGRSHGGGQQPGKLVTKPLDRFDHLTGKEGALTKHNATKYHQENMIAMEQFRDVFVTRTKDDIHSSLDTAHKRIVEDNRKALKPIVETILLCGRQNIAFRGHRGESGTIAADGNEPEINDGNFRALLRFRIRSGDTALQNHANTAKGNATYQSPDIQNELLTSAGSLTKEAVIERIKKSNFWAIIADETTDKSKREQMAVVIRYVMKDEHGHWHCREDPIAILDVFGEIKDETERLSTESEIRLSGENISSTLLRIVTSNSLSLEQCVGQGYDGATSMASERVGVAAHFKKSAQHAHYFHCAMHRLNLSAASAVTNPNIRHALDVIQELSSFFQSSAKRTTLLQDCIESADDTRVSKTKLKKLCKTRFTEKHTAIVCIRNLLRFIVEALIIMKSDWQSNESRKAATTLYNSICKPEFVISVVILEEVCSILLPLTRHLQTSGIDLVDAMNGVNDLLESLQRLHSAEEFSKLFVEAANLAELLGTSITVPRIPSRCGRSVFRSSSAIDSHGDDAETYFRINYFYPMIDNVTTDLRLRFGSSQQQCAQLASAIPFYIGEKIEEQWERLQHGILVYSEFFNDPETVLKAEYHLWAQKWLKVGLDDRPKSAIAALDHTASFPNMAILLQILGTIPVTTAEAERCFSKLERTLTSIRTTMQETRLESLLMLQIHRSDTPSEDAVINRFAQSAARRLNFLL